MKSPHSQTRACALALALALLGQGAAQAEDAKWNHFGRWTVDDPTDKFSANGKLYRMIDIAPCGKDFCGVSVDSGACGATLFRFLSNHDPNETLTGHGKWGSDQKHIFITMRDEASMSITMGEGASFPSERSGNVPTFTANYHRVGDAGCEAGAPGT